MRFEGEEGSLEVPEGERLLDSLDDAEQPPLAVACRAANCGTCAVAVMEGAHLLAPPDRDERALLAARGATTEQRLGCQLRVGAQHGVVRLRRVPLSG